MSTEFCPPPNQSVYPSDCELLAQYRNRAAQRTKQVEGPLRERAAKIRLLLLDVDGVLTDGRLIYTESGDEAKAFNTQDGLGLNLLRRSGIDIGFITARTSEIVRRRSEELSVTYLYQGVKHKLDAFKDIMQRSTHKPFEICYMGDDWIDLPLLTRVGLAACPANGVEEVRDTCHFITQNFGGHGAVRELCNLIIDAKGLRETLLQQFTT